VDINLFGLFCQQLISAPANIAAKSSMEVKITTTTTTVTTDESKFSYLEIIFFDVIGNKWSSVRRISFAY